MCCQVAVVASFGWLAGAAALIIIDTDRRLVRAPAPFPPRQRVGREFRSLDPPLRAFVQTRRYRASCFCFVLFKVRK